MNLLQLDGGGIAGSDVASGLHAAQPGPRPENTQLGGQGNAATVLGSE